LTDRTAEAVKPKTDVLLAAGALALGVLAVFLCWLPGVGLVAVPLGLAGAGVGALALRRAGGRPPSVVAPAGFGLGLSIAGFAGSLVVGGLLATGVLQAPEPRFDATTDETAKASLEAMNARLSDREKQQLQSDMVLLCFDTALQAGFANPTGGTVPMSTVLKPCHGMTASEIRRKASEIGAAIQRPK
jgi:hypothetical protein